MNSRVVGIIRFESPRMDGRGVNFSAGEEGLSLERWLTALVGEAAPDHAAAPRWESRRSMAPPRRVRANIEQLAGELEREYGELAAT